MLPVPNVNQKKTKNFFHRLQLRYIPVRLMTADVLPAPAEQITAAADALPVCAV